MASARVLPSSPRWDRAHKLETLQSIWNSSSSTAFVIRSFRISARATLLLIMLLIISSASDLSDSFSRVPVLWRHGSWLPAQKPMQRASKSKIVILVFIPTLRRWTAQPFRLGTLLVAGVHFLRAIGAW